MSKFQSVVSTVAALGTIAVTTVTAYKYVGNTRLYNAEQRNKIEQLQTQLKQLPPLTQPPPVVLPPVETPVATPDPTQSGSAQAPTPPPLPPVQ
jgi:hypothetical protein